MAKALLRIFCCEQDCRLIFGGCPSSLFRYAVSDARGKVMQMQMFQHSNTPRETNSISQVSQSRISSKQISAQYPLFDLPRTAKEEHMPVTFLRIPPSMCAGECRFFEWAFQERTKTEILFHDMNARIKPVKFGSLRLQNKATLLSAI